MTIFPKTLSVLFLLATVTLSFLLPSLAVAAEKTVHFYNWSEYIPEEVLEQFTKETGIKVVHEIYESNEELYSALRDPQTAGTFDVIVPSSYFVSKMRQEGMLRRIDRPKLPNLVNLDPRLLDKSYDPGNQYSLPYLWGVTGICVNSAKVKAGAVTSWGDLWKPEFKGKILLHDDMREVFHVALRTLGFPGNSIDPAELEQAYKKLVQLMPAVAVIDSEDPMTPFLEGKAVTGMAWNGDVFGAQEENRQLRFIFPREGAILWMDSLAIPAGAKNPEEAHKLIDFLLRPSIAAKISQEIGYATPNAKALTLLPADLKGNRTVYPTDADLKTAESQVDVGPALKIYEGYWEKLRGDK